MLADEVIRLTGPHAADRCTVPLRQVTIWDETQQRALTFLTNLRHLAASTIAAIYKERWQIELLFKALKQHLRIKTFVGTSENAVQVQIWIARIAMLLLKFLQFLQLKFTWPWSLSNLAALLRFNLLTYRDLWAWLNAPFGRPGITPMPMQSNQRVQPLAIGERQIQQHRIKPCFSQALKPHRKPARLGDLKPAGAAFFQIFLQPPDIAGIVFNK